MNKQASCAGMNPIPHSGEGTIFTISKVAALWRPGALLYWKTGTKVHCPRSGGGRARAAGFLAGGTAGICPPWEVEADYARLGA